MGVRHPPQCDSATHSRLLIARVQSAHAPQPTWLGKPVAWTRRKVRKHYVDRAALVRDGAAVITPAIVSSPGLQPANVAIGGQGRDSCWHGTGLGWLARAWQGTSDLISTAIRQMRSGCGHQAAEAVTASSSATHYLFEMTWAKVQRFNLHDAFVEAEEAQRRSPAEDVRHLMDAVRAY